MDWIKKNWPFLVIALLLALGAWGICFAGQRISEAQALARKLAGDLDREYRYSITAKQLIDRCIENNERIQRELETSLRYNQQLNERLGKLEANSRAALGILESASHR